MASIRVPTRYVEHFTTLATLGAAEFDQLQAAVSSAEPRLAPHLLWQDIAESSRLGFDLVGILDTVLGSAVIASRDGVQADQVGAALRFEAEGLDREKLESRVSRLVGTRAISLMAKAIDLAVADERYLLRSKIVTDARPVFNVVAEAGNVGEPAAVIIKHTLRIEYIENGETRTFFIALDSGDIPRLRDELTRAESKATRLSEVITRAGLLNLALEEDEDDE